MAKYNKVNEPLRQAKAFNNIAYDKKISDEKTLASYNKVRENNKLYLEGYKAGLTGEMPLDSFVELVPENDKMVPKKDHRNFKNGYLNGKKELEAQLSKNKTGLSR